MNHNDVQPPSASTSNSSKAALDIQEKYKKLKRRFFELEEKHKETTDELQRSGERNVRMREERDYLLERIMELEEQGLHGGSPGSPAGSGPGGSGSNNNTNSSNNNNPAIAPLPSALPRTLLSARARSVFEENLRKVIETEQEDGVDDLLVARVKEPVVVPTSTRTTRSKRAAEQQLSAAGEDGGGSAAGKRHKADVMYKPPEIGPLDAAMEEAAAAASNNEANLAAAAAQAAAAAAVPAEASPPAQAQATTATSSSAPAPAENTPNAATPHPLSGNPYLSIMMPPKGAAPPGGHPMFMNPYMYYPSPITPGNPYFYLTGAPPPVMYPPPTPTSSTQTRPPVPAHHPHSSCGAGPSTGGVPGGPCGGTSDIVAPPPRVKPKRLKAHTVTTKSYSIPLIPRDKSGKPMLPLNVGIMTVINLGAVCPREHFHTERYIFPVGYEVTRRYLSTINPNIEVVYHCTILDGGDGPKFQIVPSDTPERPVIAGTATGAWSSIVKQANAIRNRQHSNSVSGPDFFGLGQNTIKCLIQELAGARELRDYVWQNFIEGGPLGGRHAAVIPALPEEYDAALPRGAVYHSPLEREKRLREHQAALQAHAAHMQAQAAAAAAAAGGGTSPPDPNGNLPPPPPPSSSTTTGAGEGSGASSPSANDAVGAAGSSTPTSAAAAAAVDLQQQMAGMMGMSPAMLAQMVLSTAVSPGELPKGLSHYPQHIIAQATAKAAATAGVGNVQQGQGQGAQVGVGAGEGQGQQQHQHQTAVGVQGGQGQQQQQVQQGREGVGSGEGQHHQQQQQPTPITPSSGAGPSLASLIHAYSTAGNGGGGGPA